MALKTISGTSKKPFQSYELYQDMVILPKVAKTTGHLGESFLTSLQHVTPLMTLPENPTFFGLLDGFLLSFILLFPLRTLFPHLTPGCYHGFHPWPSSLTPVVSDRLSYFHGFAHHRTSVADGHTRLPGLSFYQPPDHPQRALTQTPQILQVPMGAFLFGFS